MPIDIVVVVVVVAHLLHVKMEQILATLEGLRVFIHLLPWPIFTLGYCSVYSYFVSSVNYNYCV